MKKLCNIRFGGFNSVNQLSQPDITPSEYREKQKILVIDDEDFEWKSDIEELGYSVRHVEDVQREFDFSKFSIILCDVDGIGKHFGQGKNGFDVMKEITLNYPLKPVIVYSGKVDLASAKAYTDLMLDKDAAFEKWEELLDSKRCR